MTKRTLTTLKPSLAVLDTRVGRPMSVAFDAERITGRRRMVRNARLRSRNPLCVRCEEAGEVGPAEEWDHIVPLWKGGTDTEDNLQGLCKRHHAEKTKAEAAERAQLAGPHCNNAARQQA